MAFYDEKLNYTKVSTTEDEEDKEATKKNNNSIKSSDVVHVKTFPDENTFRVEKKLN